MYYPKQGVLLNKSKAFYLSLIFDPRIKIKGLYNISISSGIISNIQSRLDLDYKR